MNISTNAHIKLLFALLLAIVCLAATNARSFADDGSETASQEPIAEIVLAEQSTADDSVEEPKIYNALDEQSNKTAPVAVESQPESSVAEPQTYDAQDEPSSKAAPLAVVAQPESAVAEPQTYDAHDEPANKVAPTAVLVSNLSVNGSAPSHLLSLAFIVTALTAIYVLSAPRFND